MSEWGQTTIGDVSHRVTKGTTPKMGGFTKHGISFVKVESITGEGNINPTKLAYIDEETNQLLARSILKADDLLFSIAGTIGRVARVAPAVLPANTNQALAIIRPDKSKVDVGYLLYCLRDKDRIQEALSLVVQSVQANLSLSELSAIEIPLPPMSVQRAIAGVLGTLDEKIASNTKLISTADRLSHTIFLSMNRTGSRPIPMSATAKFVNGKAFTKNASGTGRVVIRIAELNSGIGVSTVHNDIEVDDHYVARQGDLLFAWSGSLTLHRWFRPEGIINQHIFKVIPNNGYPRWLVYELLRHKLEEFKSIAADKATTMGHIQRKHLDELVAVPPIEEIHEHDDLMTVLWERALAAEVENLKLITTRDALLPQLMSGKLRVKDGAKVLEVAGV